MWEVHALQLSMYHLIRWTSGITTIRVTRSCILSSSPCIISSDEPLASQLSVSLGVASSPALHVSSHQMNLWHHNYPCHKESHPLQLSMYRLIRWTSRITTIRVTRSRILSSSPCIISSDEPLASQPGHTIIKVPSGTVVVTHLFVKKYLLKKT